MSPFDIQIELLSYYWNFDTAKSISRTTPVIKALQTRIDDIFDSMLARLEYLTMYLYNFPFYFICPCLVLV